MSAISRFFRQLLSLCIIGVVLYGVGSLFLLYTNRKVELRDAYNQRDVHKFLRALGVNRNVSSRKQWKQFVAGTGSSITGAIPLGVGLTVVTAITEDLGDFESIKHIESMDSELLRMTYSAEIPPPPYIGNTGGSGPETQHIFAKRSIRRGDLQSAHEYMQLFGPGSPEVMPNTNAISVSSAVLNDLKSNGETSFKFQAASMVARAAIAFHLIQDLMRSSQRLKDDDLASPAAANRSTCILKRMETTDVAFPVLINDKRVTVPALHAFCRTGGEEDHFYFLDDSKNPLVLAWQMGDDGDTLQVVKISYPQNELERASQSHEKVTNGDLLPTVAARAESKTLKEHLEQEGRAEIQGIYFDFASDEIRPESEPAMEAIVELLNENSNWKLIIEGHTDNIGGYAYNMDLSQRRAAAVKSALVKQHQIAADRLSVVGFGASRSKESNNTLEGRARNRRVELVRQ